MPTKPRKRANLRGKTATVAIVRNGVSIEIADIPATDAGLVAAELLTAYRQLTKAFPELTVELEGVNGGAIAVPEDSDDGEDGADPISAKGPMGFTTR